MNRSNRITHVSNPYDNQYEPLTDIGFCYDLCQYLGMGACCFDLSCPHSGYCNILIDSVKGRG